MRTHFFENMGFESGDKGGNVEIKKPSISSILKIIDAIRSVFPFLKYSPGKISEERKSEMLRHLYGKDTVSLSDAMDWVILSPSYVFSLEESRFIIEFFENSGVLNEENGKSGLILGQAMKELRESGCVPSAFSDYIHYKVKNRLDRTF